MLLPEYISPEDSLYYNGAIILNYLREYKNIGFTKLYLRKVRISGEILLG
ncbi:ABC-three component system middle component 6 [Aeromonas caviae]